MQSSTTTALPGSTGSASTSVPTTTSSAVIGSSASALTYSGTVAGIAVRSTFGGIIIVISIGFAFFLGRKSVCKWAEQASTGTTTDPLAGGHQLPYGQTAKYNYEPMGPGKLDGSSRSAEVAGHDLR
ncbi:hypothetical protein SCUP515_00898 [Seiridium cupressi]